MLAFGEQQPYNIPMPKENRLRVIIEAYATPDRYEIKVAFALLDYFGSNIILRKSGQSYSPDLLIQKTNQLWEIKNIRGNSVNTIEHNLAKAKMQSGNIIISLYRTKMTPHRAIGRIKAELKKRRDIKRLILLTKDHKIIEIK